MNGLIRLHVSQTVLLDQLRHFPMADHDDGPDALHMLWMLAVSGFGAIEYVEVPKTGRWHYADDDSPGMDGIGRGW